MRRADRLFEILQILRRARAPVTAAAIAAELETTPRTVYRDVAALLAQRVPIRGEAGVGYVLEAGFDMPPLMLTSEEIEAAILGAQWVAGHGDPALARAAENLIAKIVATVPERLKALALEPAGRAAPAWKAAPDRVDMVRVRQAIHAGRKLVLVYRDQAGRESRRTIWPVLIGYMEAVRCLVGWCELRADFRSFRTDRIEGAEFLDEVYPARPAALRAAWRKQLFERRAAEAAPNVP